MWLVRIGGSRVDASLGTLRCLLSVALSARFMIFANHILTATAATFYSIRSSASVRPPLPTGYPTLVAYNAPHLPSPSTSRAHLSSFPPPPPTPPPPTSMSFDSLPDEVKASIRANQQKQKEKKTTKAKKQRISSPPRPPTPALPPNTRATITAREYHKEAPYRFKDETVPPTLSSVPLLVNAARDPTCNISECSYFQFHGTQAELWEPAFFAFLAHSGFFVITDEVDDPLPELQPFYGVLTPAAFEASPHNRKCLKKLAKEMAREGSCPFKLMDSSADADRCWAALEAYHGERNEHNWLSRKYLAAMEAATAKRGVNYRLHIIEMMSGGEVVAAEFGFSCGNVYTSLSGWCKRSKERLGEVQLCLLGRWLFRSGFKFWSLGHCYVPEMVYKQKLGQLVYERGAFLDLLAEHAGPFVGGGAERKFGLEVEGAELLLAAAGAKLDVDS